CHEIEDAQEIQVVRVEPARFAEMFDQEVDHATANREQARGLHEELHHDAFFREVFSDRSTIASATRSRCIVLDAFSRIRSPARSHFGTSLDAAAASLNRAMAPTGIPLSCAPRAMWADSLPTHATTSSLHVAAYSPISW